jgi:Holliday junction resolvase
LTRGIYEERGLVNILWKRGFAVVRVPASGSATKRPLPDMVAGSRKRGLHLAIEAKAIGAETIYVDKKCVDQLVEFAETFGCEPFLAVKFKGRARNWIFLRPEQLRSTKGKSLRVCLKDAVIEGIDIRTLVGEGKQTRLPS